MKKRLLAYVLAAVLLLGGCSTQTAGSPVSETVAQPVPTETAVQPTPAKTDIEPQQTQIPAQYHWDTTGIYADNEAFEQELQNVAQDLIPALTDYQGKLNSEEDIIAYFKHEDIVGQKLRKLDVYATLLTAQDLADTEATAIMQKVNKVQDQYSEVTAYVAPELLSNSDGFLDKLAENQEMEPFVTQIERLRNNAGHVLPDETEVLLIPLSNAANGASTLFSKLTSADMTYNAVTDANGNEVVIDESTYSTILMGNPDREYRRTCSEALLGAYGQYRNTFAQNMDNFVQTVVSLAHSHNYATAKEASLAAYTVPSQVYDNLIQASDDNLDTVYRYYALRKEMMGVDKIYTSDLYYPIVDELNVTFPYEDAQEIIIKALAPLGEDYQKNLQRAFDERWIDVYPSDGKDSGAFSIGLNGIHPYLLTNYTDDYNSLSTLAHELGHAMHQYESAQNQKSDFNSDPTAFTSEVASTTNELLLADYMIKNAANDNEKLYYLFSELTLLNNTFFTQSMFSEFEDGMYKIVEEGGSLNADNLEALWLSIMEKYDGPDCQLGDSAKYGWSRIPHFYYNYYVYQYATSISAACTISQRIENGEDEAVENYLEFLKSGDSNDGVSILKIADVDITSPSLADALITRYNSLIDQIEAIVK